MTPTSAIMGAGLGNDVALLTDGRFSGGSHVSTIRKKSEIYQFIHTLTFKIYECRDL